PTHTKSYGYDALGTRVSMTDTPTGGTAADYTYGYDSHGSVELLLNSTGAATAAYGYTPYGAADAGLTKGDTSATDPSNPFRYTARRLDSGSGTLDMGARRFGPDIGRFVQYDLLHNALGNLSLSSDPLTGNRYGLAGGNPVSFVEWDGHMAVSIGDNAADEARPEAPEDLVRELVGTLNAAGEAGKAARKSVQNAARALAGSDDPVVRSRASFILSNFGKATRFAEHPWFKKGTRGFAALGWLLDVAKYSAEKKSPLEAYTRASINAAASYAGAVAGGAAGAAACSPLTVPTVLCAAGGALFGGVAAGAAGEVVGDLIFEDVVVYDACPPGGSLLQPTPQCAIALDPHPLPRTPSPAPQLFPQPTSYAWSTEWWNGSN
ncbi:MAG: hypothetical protein LC640_04885, partial [Frankia sp.]|nr:hypothetical protein [Frankia sp.]